MLTIERHGHEISSFPRCPLDLQAGITYMDTADGWTFTVASCDADGPVARITNTDGLRFVYGGLYRGLHRVFGAVR